MRKLPLLACAAVLAGAVQAGAAETVKLQIVGAFCPGCVKALGDSLGGVTGIDGKVELKATKKDPQIISIKLDTEKGDLGDIAKAVSNTDTPHKDTVAPSATFIFKAPGLTDGNKGKLKDALKDVKGVEAAKTKCDPKKKEIYVLLSGKGGAKLADIKKALADYAK
jgi:copper chaperone CopZ